MGGKEATLRKKRLDLDLLNGSFFKGKNAFYGRAKVMGVGGLGNAFSI